MEKEQLSLYERLMRPGPIQDCGKPIERPLPMPKQTPVAFTPNKPKPKIQMRSLDDEWET